MCKAGVRVDKMAWNSTQSSICQSLSNQLDGKQSISNYSLLFSKKKHPKNSEIKIFSRRSEWAEKAATLRQCKRMQLTHTVACTESRINTKRRVKWLKRPGGPIFRCILIISLWSDELWQPSKHPSRQMGKCTKRFFCALS